MSDSYILFAGGYIPDGGVEGREETEFGGARAIFVTLVDMDMDTLVDMDWPKAKFPLHYNNFEHSIVSTPHICHNHHNR